MAISSIPLLRRAGTALIVLALAGCAETTISAQLTPIEEALSGTWDLFSVCGGVGFHCIPPAESSEPSRYVFTPTKHRVSAYRNGQLLFSKSYQLTEDSSQQGFSAVLTIGGGPLVDPRPLYVGFSIEGGLMLFEGCCDRFTFEYHRPPGLDLRSP